jgi:hypothetical protein
MFCGSEHTKIPTAAGITMTATTSRILVEAVGDTHDASGVDYELKPRIARRHR